MLIQILSSFSARDLLPFASVSRRFAAVVSRLHYSRLHAASLLQDHEVILECFHPGVTTPTPTLFCEYLGTDGLESAGKGGRFGEMNALYTRFRPYLSDEHQRPRPRYPTRRVAEGADIQPPESPTIDVSLESKELFSQLCTVPSLIKVGPKRRLFLSRTNIIDSWIRVLRTWLETQAGRPAGDPGRAQSLEDDESILWTPNEDFGLRFRVVKNDNPHAPAPADEDPPASYILHYEGKHNLSRCWLTVPYID